jgi:hypothetical protein
MESLAVAGHKLLSHDSKWRQDLAPIVASTPYRHQFGREHLALSMVSPRIRLKDGKSAFGLCWTIGDITWLTHAGTLSSCSTSLS